MNVLLPMEEGGRETGKEWVVKEKECEMER